MGSIRRFRLGGGYEKWDRWSEWPMVGLSVIFLCVLILPLSASLTPEEAHALALLNIILWIAFGAEYLIRLYLAIERRAFVRSHVFDLLVIAVPFFRPLRLVRVVSLLVSSGRRAGGLVVRQVLAYVICLTAIVMSICAIIVYHSERNAPGSNIHSLGDSFWWALTTTTTVGYGDKFPVTTAGRITAGLLMLTGIALVGTITAAVAAAFVNIVRGKPSTELAEDLNESRDALAAKIDEMSSALNELRGEVRLLRAGSSRPKSEVDGATSANAHGATPTTT